MASAEVKKKPVFEEENGTNKIEKRLRTITIRSGPFLFARFFYMIPIE